MAGIMLIARPNKKPCAKHGKKMLPSFGRSQKKLSKSLYEDSNKNLTKKTLIN
jgi:hypothetical protein